MKQNRIRKYHKTLKVDAAPVDRMTADKNLFDIVLKQLYNNADDALHLENQIYAPNNIKLNNKESERVWEIMVSSGWITPIIGFGNAGKVELTKTGYQLMSQFGGYSEYLTAMQSNQQPQTIILPIQIQDQDDSEERQHQIAPPMPEKATAKKMITRKGKNARR